MLKPQPVPYVAGSSLKVHSRAPCWLHLSAASCHVAEPSHLPRFESPLPQAPNSALKTQPSSSHVLVELIWNGSGGGVGGGEGG